MSSLQGRHLKGAIILSCLIVPLYGTAFLIPTESSQKRWVLETSAARCGLLFGPEIGMENIRRMDIPKPAFWFMQPQRRWTLNWKIPEILSLLKPATSQDRSHVLWLSSGVNSCANVARLFTRAGRLPVTLVPAWPYIATHKPTWLELSPFKYVVLGQVHRGCFNVPYGEKLTRFQEGVRELFRTEGVTPVLVEQPFGVTAEIYALPEDRRAPRVASRVMLFPKTNFKRH